MTLNQSLDQQLSKQDLIKKIDLLRAEMVQLGLSKSMNHPHTIRKSQLLDFYISEYQNRFPYS